MTRHNSIDVFLKLHIQRKFSKETDAAAKSLEAVGMRGAKSIASFAATGEKLKNFGSTMTRGVTLPILGIGAALLSPLNKAIELGLTRTEVADVLARLYFEHPEEITVDVLLAALLDQLEGTQ